MLTRLYVDNYKSLVNFDLRLGKEHLFLGRNGTGKSTVFDLLDGLSWLAAGGKSLSEVFSTRTLNRWGGRTLQTIQLEFEDGPDTHKYKLEIDSSGAKCRVKSEALLLNDAPLMTFDGKDLVVFRDDGTSTTALAQDDRLLLSAIPDHADLKNFRNGKLRVIGIFVTRLIPSSMDDESSQESHWVRTNMSNVASFYRRLLQEQPDEMEQMREDLRAVIEGFDSLRLETAGSTKILKARFRFAAEEKSATSVEFLFSELSDGQRALICLYMLLHAITSTMTVCLDEPDNFVALREIQPLLSAFREKPNVQLLVISHHPEIINELARDHGIVFERMPGGPIRTSPWRAPPDEALTPAELVARGWEDGA